MGSIYTVEAKGYVRLFCTFIKEFGVTYPITTKGDNLKLFGAVAELNPSGSIPFMVLFNKKGQYLQYYIGMKPEEMLFSDISKAIAMP